jgi:hypothetical protein
MRRAVVGRTCTVARGICDRADRGKARAQDTGRQARPQGFWDFGPSHLPERPANVRDKAVLTEEGRGRCR